MTTTGSAAAAAQVKLSVFEWNRANTDLYSLEGPKVVFKAGGTDLYRPVLGSLEMKPNTGKYFYEIRTNGENMRIGVATAGADLNGEMGAIPEVYSVNLQTGACQVNGETRKKLWRLVVPVAGGVFGFLFDTDNGTLQLYFNEEFHGTPFNDKFDLKGKTVYPCVGIAGVELHNRDIGVGKKCAVVTEKPELYRAMQL